jgi:hypothetical protein
MFRQYLIFATASEKSNYFVTSVAAGRRQFQTEKTDEFGFYPLRQGVGAVADLVMPVV